MRYPVNENILTVGVVGLAAYLLWQNTKGVQQVTEGLGSTVQGVGSSVTKVTADVADVTGTVSDAFSDLLHPTTIVRKVTDDIITMLDDPRAWFGGSTSKVDLANIPKGPILIEGKPTKKWQSTEGLIYQSMGINMINSGSLY